MKKINLLLAVGLMGLMFFSCCNNSDSSCGTDNQNATQATVTTNAADAWVGVYKGTLPCADCEGIKTTIVLNTDGTYTKVQEYLKGEDTTSFEEKGEVKYAASTQMMSLKSGKELSLYKLVGKQLIQLDAKGNMADQYVLNKQ